MKYSKIVLVIMIIMLCLTGCSISYGKRAEVKNKGANKKEIIADSSSVPYNTEYGGDEYQIPKDEFEGPIQTYLNIGSEELELDAVYNKDTQTYRYRPRGIHDSEFPYEPYPEVVAYKVQNDGTIKLTVNAVWVREEMDKALTSELVVRPMGNRGFQYVSNQVIPSPGSTNPKWYSKRMTDEEWNQYYKNRKR